VKSRLLLCSKPLALWHRNNRCGRARPLFDVVSWCGVLLELLELSVCVTRGGVER
jgi:hypothetical protein